MTRRVRLAATGLAMVVAAGLGLLAGLVPGHHEEPEWVDYDAANVEAARTSAPGDRMQAAIDGVRDDGFYVGPELRVQLSAAEVARIERIVARAPVPMFVVWWSDTYDAGYYTPYAAIDQLRAGVGRDGFYAVVTEGGVSLTEALGYETPYVDANAKGRPAAALTRFVKELAAVPAEPERLRTDSDWDYWGGPGGGLAAGLLFAVGGYLGLMAVLALIAALVPRRAGSGGRP